MTNRLTDPPSDPLTERRPRLVARPRLRTQLITAVVPAYLFPAVTAAANALLIPDHRVASNLAVAAWTTIAIPSAVASLLVTLWNFRRTPPAQPRRGRTARAALLAALTCAVLSAGVSAVLIGNGLLPLSTVRYTVTSAAIGGALAARRWARTNRALDRRRAEGPAK